jgi:hypothetical protein
MKKKNFTVTLAVISGDITLRVVALNFIEVIEKIKDFGWEHSNILNVDSYELFEEGEEEVIASSEKEKVLELFRATNKWLEAISHSIGALGSNDNELPKAYRSPNKN